MNVKDLVIELKEAIRLMDPPDTDLGLGAAFIVDTKEELITKLKDLSVSDSVAMQLGQKEITITKTKLNKYSFLIDFGFIKNDFQRSSVKEFKNLSYEEVLDLIQLEI